MFLVQKIYTVVGTGRTPIEEILKLECEGLVGPVATSLTSLEKWFLAPLKNALFFIICLSGRQITAAFFKLGDLCQISSAEDVADILPVSLLR